MLIGHHNSYSTYMTVQHLYNYCSFSGTLSTISGCQEAELPPVLAPPPLFYPTQHWTLTLPPPPPPMSTPPHPPPLTNCDPHQSLCAALEWSLPHPALSVIYLFWQSDKRLFFFLHYSHLHSFVLFYLTGLHYICHVPYVTLSLFFIFIVLQCPHLYICIVCMFVCTYG